MHGARRRSRADLRDRTRKMKLPHGKTGVRLLGPHEVPRKLPSSRWYGRDIGSEFQRDLPDQQQFTCSASARSATSGLARFI